MFEQITSDVMVLIVVFVQMHDTDGNDKLDGCELVKSLIHWHGEKREFNQFVLFLSLHFFGMFIRLLLPLFG